MNGLFSAFTCDLVICWWHRKAKVVVNIVILQHLPKSALPSTDYLKQWVWQLPPTYWVALCVLWCGFVQGCVCVCVCDTSSMIYVFWRSLISAGHHSVQGISCVGTEQLSSPVSHMCGTVPVVNLKRSHQIPSAESSYHRLSLGVRSLNPHVDVVNRAPSASVLLAAVAHKSWTLCVLCATRKPPVVCSSTPGENGGHRNCFLWCLWELLTCICKACTEGGNESIKCFLRSRQQTCSQLNLP